MAGYDIEYLGERILSNDKGLYLRKSEVMLTDNRYELVAKSDILRDGEVVYTEGEKIPINPENLYYQIELFKEGELEARLFPRVQFNPTMGMLSSPDITRGITRDLYTHVSASPSGNQQEEPEWGMAEERVLRMGDTLFINDYVAILDTVKAVRKVHGYELKEDDVAAMATIRIKAEHDQDYVAEPAYVIRDTKGDAYLGLLPDEVSDIGARLTLSHIDPIAQTFTISIQTRQKDWVIIKAMEKPLINVLWLGTGLLAAGFIISMVRRFREPMA